jgi:hypothetical protein
MTMNNPLRNLSPAIRRHPRRTAAILGVPLLAASVITGSTMASAHPKPSLAVSLAQLHATAAPDIHTNFSQNLPGPVVKHVKDLAKFRAHPGDDGCDHDYGNGNVNVCVPWQIPAKSGQACAWLKSHGYPALQVTATDRQHLDTNRDGIACDAGDLGVN